MRSSVRTLILAVVGAGRVGCALGRSLHQKGWRIGPVVTRSMRTARAARRRIGSGKPQAGLSEAVLAADVILIATPDRVIAKTAEALARIVPGPLSHAQRPVRSARARQTRGAKTAGGKPWRGKIVLHTSGALGRDVLAPLRRQGAATGSLHPLQTFSGRGIPSLAGPSLKSLTCAIEGSTAALRVARRICRQLGAVPVGIPQHRKSAYHAAAALAAGQILAVAEAAVRILMASGFSRKRAVLALLPLTRQTLANYERVGPREAWTGPLNRGDFAVIERHLEALRRFPREYREAYDALSRLGVKVLANGSGSRKRHLEQTLARIK